MTIPARGARAALLAITAALALAAPASADIRTGFFAGELSVVTNGTDAIAVTCVGGLAKINGQDPPVGRGGVSPAPCADIAALRVSGGAEGPSLPEDGPSGDNRIDLRGLTRAAFAHLLTVAVEAGPGNDEILGSELPEQLRGEDGEDTIEGGGGNDVMEGGEGADLLRARDGGGDRVQCGAGIDTALTDAADTVTDCERGDAPAPPSPGGGQPAPVPAPPAGEPRPDTTAPVVTLLGSQVKVVKGVAALKLRCVAGESLCGGTLRLVRGGAKLGAGTFTLAGGEVRTVSAPLTKRGRKQVAAHAKLGVQVKLTATDAAGNTRTSAQALTLKR